MHMCMGPHVLPHIRAAKLYTHTHTHSKACVRVKRQTKVCAGICERARDVEERRGAAIVQFPPKIYTKPNKSETY